MYAFLSSVYEKGRLCGSITGIRSDVPLPLRMHAAVFATGQRLCRCCPEE